MPPRPSWQTALSPSGPAAPALPDAAGRLRRRTVRLILGAVVAIDLAVVAWLVFAVDMPAAQRWLVVGLILLGLPMSLFVLRRALGQRFGV